MLEKQDIPSIIVIPCSYSIFIFFIYIIIVVGNYNTLVRNGLIVPERMCLGQHRHLVMQLFLFLQLEKKLDLRLHSGVPVCLWSLPVAEIMFYRYIIFKGLG